MKKLFIALGFTIFGFVAQSQDLKFTVGGHTPGKLADGRAYEDFLSGKIKVVDGTGAEYRFVKAEFTLLNKSGKTISFKMTKPGFEEKQWTQVIQEGSEGTVYTYSNITVKDAAGKEYILSKVVFEFPSTRG